MPLNASIICSQHSEEWLEKLNSVYTKLDKEKAEPTVFSTDFSAFDASVPFEYKSAVHDAYVRYFATVDKHSFKASIDECTRIEPLFLLSCIRDYLKYSERGEILLRGGKGENDIKFKKKDGVNSGDADTYLTNTILNLCAILYARIIARGGMQHLDAVIQDWLDSGGRVAGEVTIHKGDDMVGVTSKQWALALKEVCKLIYHGRKEAEPVAHGLGMVCKEFCMGEPESNSFCSLPFYLSQGKIQVSSNCRNIMYRLGFSRKLNVRNHPDPAVLLKRLRE